MRGAAHFLFGFTGRLSRRGWWPAFLTVLSITVIGMLVAQPAFFLDPLPIAPSPALIAVQITTLWPALAITKRRFNDRAYPPWVFWLAAAPFALISAVDVVYLSDDAIERLLMPLFAVDGPAVDPLSWAYAGAWAVCVASALFLFVDNGFLAGTTGPNRYGPDPLI